MKLFISWSGKLSHLVAISLRDWIPSVIQEVEPYVSSEDIEKGARWEAELAKELDKSNFGIVCLTRDNVASPWLNFEAGALAKSLGKARVVPVLFNMDRVDVPSSSPLSQFQSTVFERHDVEQTLRSINGRTEKPLPQQRLSLVVEKWWPDLHSRLAEIEEAYATNLAPQQSSPTEHEMIVEMLELTRAHRRDIASLMTEIRLGQSAVNGGSRLSESLYIPFLARELPQFFHAREKRPHSADYLALLKDVIAAMADFRSTTSRDPTWEELATQLGITSNELRDRFLNTPTHIDQD